MSIRETCGKQNDKNRICKNAHIQIAEYVHFIYLAQLNAWTSVIFYKKQSFWRTRREVIALIQEEPYKECLKNCTFSGNFAASIMVFCLRKHFMLPVYFFSRLK